MSEVFCARLASGEHIIGLIKSADSEHNTINLENALLVNIVPTDNGYGVQFMPVSPLARPPLDKGSSVVLNLSQVLYGMEYDENLVNNYKQNVSSIITGSLFTGR
jgi:hypothetical protein